MAVRLVQVPNIRPNRCAFLPHVGASGERVGFWDFGTDLDREHVYLSHTAFLMVCEKAGFGPVRAHQVELARLRERLDEAERGRQEAEKALEAIGTLKAVGRLEQARKPGRPPKQKAQA